MNETTRLTAYEDKTTATNRGYTRFKTSNGWMTCWSKAIADGLKKQINGALLNLQIETNEAGYKSIKSFSVAEEAIGGSEEDSPRAAKPLKKTTSYELSYAKDIFNVLALQVSEENAVKRHETYEYLATFAVQLIERMKAELEKEAMMPHDETEEEV